MSRQTARIVASISAVSFAAFFFVALSPQPSLSQDEEGGMSLAPATEISGAANLKVEDNPNDAGVTVLVTFAASDWEDEGVLMETGEQVSELYYVVEWGTTQNGPWNEGDRFSVLSQFIDEDRGTFGFYPEGYDTTHYSRLTLLAEGVEVENGTDVFVRIGLATGEKLVPSYYFAGIASGSAADNWFNLSRKYHFLFVVVLSIVIFFFINQARRGIKLYIRRIAGLEAIDEAIGRATEMGRPMFYLCGLAPASEVSTIASLSILGQLAKKVAEYESTVRVPCFDPIVMSVCQEVVKQSYTEAGRPDDYNADNIFFLTQAQFSYVSAVNGMMVREKPAANFYFGYFYAESLLLAETGNMVGAIQIAGTDALVQIPFFITACDYTLIGEELYAASAYISREPKLMGSIKAIDMAKAVIIGLILIGTILGTIVAFGGPENLEILTYIFADN